MKFLQVEHACPQCGGPFILEETDRLFSCTFCRVRMYLTAKDYFRYYIPPAVNISDESFFVPYWRFRGMFFSIRPFTIKNKVLDTSFCATNHTFFPLSLGLRTQTLKLKFASSKMKPEFLSSHIGFSDVLSRIEKKTTFIDGSPYAGSVFHKAFLGDTVSMIYSPVFIQNRALYDAVLNRPFARLTTQRGEALHDVDGKKGWNILFLSALCPDCGWDLLGERNSVVLFCKNCDTAWYPKRGSFMKQEFQIIQWKEKQTVYLPFWKLKVRFRGIVMRSFADLIKTANLPKAVQKEWEQKNLFFWSPAFHVHPRMYLRLIRQTTILQPSFPSRDRLPASPLFPVTLNASEAFEGVKLTLSSLAVAKRNVYPLLPDISITAEHALLIFFPFSPSGNDLVQPQMKFSIQRNTIH